MRIVKTDHTSARSGTKKRVIHVFLIVAVALSAFISVVIWANTIDKGISLEMWHEIQKEEMDFVAAQWDEPVDVYPENILLSTSFFVEAEDGSRYHMEIWEKGDTFNYERTPITHPHSDTTERLNNRMVNAIKRHDESIRGAVD